MNELELFAGAGGGILASQLLGHNCVCAVELDPYARAVLMARQDDGSLPPFPIWDDVCTFDGLPWRGLVDCVSGGFPCKGGSPARTNNPKRTTGTGLGHHESALWREQCRIIREVEPAYARVENSAHLHRNGLETILGDLASMGFDAEWDQLSAAFVGAPHERQRTWLIALPTPTAHNAKEGNYPAERTRNSLTLGAILGGRIDPAFTEWMMWWPSGWTDLSPLGMDKFRAWVRSHGKL